ncbi:MAG: LCP family protein [Chloroflexota bacterium]
MASYPPPPFDPDPHRKRRSPVLRALLLSFVLGMFCIPVAVGAALYLALAGAFDHVVVPGAPAGVPGMLSLPRLQPSTVDTPAWSGTERVNFLLLGTDQRAGATDVPRTDTIIVATLDPVTHSAGLLSLPRDLWVPIPEYGNNRVNAAFELGEQLKPGGGPELTRQTVEQLLGVPIHHYVLVGFDGFEQLVDLVGGVIVDVERPIKDDEFPDQNYSMRRIFFQPGLQRLTGETALWYVRTRHTDSDFGRARRQQQFLLALRKQVLQLDLLPKAPAILAALSDTFQTDLRPHEMLGLARIAKDLDTSRIVNRVIDETMTTHWVTSAGAQVEVPDEAAIDQVVRHVFGTT